MLTFRSQQQDYETIPIEYMYGGGRIGANREKKLGNWAYDSSFKCIKVANGNENAKHTRKYAAEIRVKEAKRHRICMRALRKLGTFYVKVCTLRHVAYALTHTDAHILRYIWMYVQVCTCLCHLS